MIGHSFKYSQCKLVQSRVTIFPLGQQLPDAIPNMDSSLCNQLYALGQSPLCHRQTNTEKAEQPQLRSPTTSSMQLILVYSLSSFSLTSVLPSILLAPHGSSDQHWSLWHCLAVVCPLGRQDGQYFFLLQPLGLPFFSIYERSQDYTML